MKTGVEDRTWPFAKGSGSTLLAVTTVFAAAVALWFLWSNLLTSILVLLVFLLWVLVLYFFRDPNRIIEAESGLVLGPGDGEIVAIEPTMEQRYLNDQVLRISLFLSVLDVHIQRVPIGGKVAQIEHRPGKFLQAFRPEASEVNEHISMVIQTDYGDILVKQIAGILARRCVNYAKTGNIVCTGQRYGLIRFGSRVDLFLPQSAKLLAQVGDKVLAGITPIAQLSRLT